MREGTNTRVIFAFKHVDVCGVDVVVREGDDSSIVLICVDHYKDVVKQK